MKIFLVSVVGENVTRFQIGDEVYGQVPEFGPIGHVIATANSQF